MKTALLGHGKTGSKVAYLLEDVTIFDQKNPPTLESLKEHDVIICFTTEKGFYDNLGILIESNIPCVVGTTGIDVDSLRKKLQSHNVAWIYGSNFSMGMNLVFNLLKSFRTLPELFDNPTLNIIETHHTAKLDAPSGSALTMKEMLDLPLEIESVRTGDVVGVHEFTVDTHSETLSIKHEAKDRKVFASGAIWAANYLLENKEKMPKGLHMFLDIISSKLSKD